MTKINLQLDNSYIPKRTVVNPQSPYLRYRRFYCRRKELVNAIVKISPVAITILILIIINGK
ncbi:MAG: hypothetical protein WC121_14245 [Candidatus Kapaibacterium sp.]